MRFQTITACSSHTHENTQHSSISGSSLSSGMQLRMRSVLKLGKSVVFNNEEIIRVRWQWRYIHSLGAVDVLPWQKCMGARISISIAIFGTTGVLMRQHCKNMATFDHIIIITQYVADKFIQVPPEAGYFIKGHLQV